MAFTRSHFACVSLHALYHRFTINHRGTAANRPDAGAVSVRSQAVTLFLIQKLIEDDGCR